MVIARKAVDMKVMTSISASTMVGRYQTLLDNLFFVLDIFD